MVDGRRAESLTRKAITGVFAAATVVAVEGLAAVVIEFPEAIRRAQAAGACLATLVLIAVGLALGYVHTRSGRTAPAQAMATFNAPPWLVVVFTAVPLAVLASGLMLSLDDEGQNGQRSALIAMLAADIFVGLPYLLLGAVQGSSARPSTFVVVPLAVLLYGLLAYLGFQSARLLSFEPIVISAAAAFFAMAAAVIAGFTLSTVLRSLALVEHLLSAMLLGYAAFGAVALGPVEWTAGLNLPDEQIFLALALVPTLLVASLFMVGGSLGFLLFGGGGFDPSFQVERRIALRFLRAHQRDGFVGIVTVIAVVGVCLGVTALIVVLSIMSGFENDLKMKILGAHAHIQVTKKGIDFVEYRDVEAQVSGVKGVTSAAAFVQGDAMISTDGGLSGTLVKGLDPDDPDGIAEISAILEQGRIEYLRAPSTIPGTRPPVRLVPPGSGGNGEVAGAHELTEAAAPRRVLPGILLGRQLARSLRAYVGDTVKLVSPASEEIGPLGPTPKLRRFRVAGIFYSGMYEYDAKLTYLSIRQAQRFFGMRKRATGVELKVEDIDDTARVQSEIVRRLGGFPYEVRDWREMNKELFSALLLEKLAMFVALGMIVMVASFLIVAVLMMIVLQRKKEIAVLKSLGATDASVMKVFVVQGLALGMSGAALGGALGVLVCEVLRRFVRLDEDVFYIERLPVVMDPLEIVAIALSAAIMSYLATIYPAIVACRHPPVEGLRDE